MLCCTELSSSCETTSWGHSLFVLKFSQEPRSFGWILEGRRDCLLERYFQKYLCSQCDCHLWLVHSSLIVLSSGLTLGFLFWAAVWCSNLLEWSYLVPSPRSSLSTHYVLGPENTEEMCVPERQILSWFCAKDRFGTEWHKFYYDK